MRFFDYNATTPTLPEARAAWSAANDTLWLNPSSPYRAAAAVHTRMEVARESLAAKFGVAAQRIIFNSGATEGNNAVFAHWANTLGETARVGVSPTEHPSVIQAARHYFGDRVVWLPLDGAGTVDSAGIDFAQLSAVSVMAANNETGLINPWPELAERCQGVGIPFHCDASQWIGKMPLDGLEACDFVTACAHKCGGPKGVGLLIAPEGSGHGLLGGAQEGGRRAGTEDVAGVLAMLAALESVEAQRASCTDRGREAFWHKLSQAMPRVIRMNEKGPALWNTLSIAMPDFASARWIRALEKRGFLVSAGSACSTGKAGPSHVLAAMGIGSTEAAHALRISSGWGTTEADWDALFEALVASYEALQSEASDSNSQVISI